MKPAKITAVVFVLVIVGFMMSAFYMLASTKLIKTPHTPKVNYANINWELSYPFKEGEKKTYESAVSWYRYLKERLKEYSSTKLLGYYRFIEAARKYKDTVGWNMVSHNSIISLKDGYLTGCIQSRDVREDAKSVKEFADFCAEKGIDFMYINFPNKICASEDKDVSGVLDFVNQNADRFLALLKESGVKYYDFRKILHEDGMNHHEAFFVTDGHWKPETGLWASGHILKILRDDFGWPVDPKVIAPENFNYVIYHNSFLGGEGRYFTFSSAKPEDFTMIYPKFKTHLKFEIQNLRINSEGDFSIIYNMNALETKGYYETNNLYAAYFYGNQPVSRLENKLVKNGKRLLVIYNSFSFCVIPFISLEIQNVDAIYANSFTGSVRTFIETVKPDAVIIQYHSAVPGSEGNFYDFK